MFKTWMIVLAVVIVLLVIAAVVIAIVFNSSKKSKNACCSSSSCSTSTSSSTTGITGACPCTDVVAAILAGPMVEATFPRLGSAESVLSQHWAGKVRDSTQEATETGSSLNWSGYATVQTLGATGIGTVTQAVGTWTVPTVSGPATGSTFSSAWVGIDGFASPTVEQCGTEHDFVDGAPVYFAWFEMFPAGSFEIVGFPVSPGDSMSASVTYLGSGVFQLGMRNNTAGVSVLIPTSLTTNVNALRSSAEWIVEAPSDGSGILPLAELTTIAWTGCCATVDGIQGPICTPDRDDVAITMINTNLEPISVPSEPTCDCTAFTVVQPI